MTNASEVFSESDVNTIELQKPRIDSFEKTATATIDPKQLARDLQAFCKPQPMRRMGKYA